MALVFSAVGGLLPAMVLRTAPLFAPRGEAVSAVGGLVVAAGGRQGASPPIVPAAVPGMVTALGVRRLERRPTRTP